MSHPFVRVRTRNQAREYITISGCGSDAEVETRRTLIRKVAAQLVEGGRADRVKGFCLVLGEARTAKRIKQICASVEELLATESVSPESILFRDLALEWTSGGLHERFPDYVTKKDSSDDKTRLRLYINPLVGDISIVNFKLEDGQKVMRKLPPAASSAQRRQVAQVMYKLLRYAVAPCGYREQSPLPVGFLPKIRGGKAKQYLYPDEEAAILRCTNIPIVYRMVYGVLAREGLRLGELIGNKKKKTPPIDWAEFDLVRGVVTLDKNKTNDARAWMLDPSTVRALRLWKKFSPRTPFPDADPNRLAPRFREHLELAFTVRPELTAPATSQRRPIRAHDLRATFVTIALANGKSESWIQDRTGHKSSAMINLYRRTSRTFADLQLGTLLPMDELIPELGGQRVGSEAAGKVAS
jgi:integrase